MCGTKDASSPSAALFGRRGKAYLAAYPETTMDDIAEVLGASSASPLGRGEG